MALTNAMLKAMGIENDQRDEIMTAHQEVLESIKAERDELRDKAAKVPELEKAIEELKAAQPTEDWEAKYNELMKEFDLYKEKMQEEQALNEKASLYRSMLREAGIDEKRIDPIMKVTDLSTVAVKDGAIADSDSVKQAIEDEWGGFITHSATHGAEVETPPTNTGAQMTRDEIMAIEDTTARQDAIAQNLDLFR